MSVSPEIDRSNEQSAKQASNQLIWELFILMQWKLFNALTKLTTVKAHFSNYTLTDKKYVQSSLSDPVTNFHNTNSQLLVYRSSWLKQQTLWPSCLLSNYVKVKELVSWVKVKGFLTGDTAVMIAYYTKMMAKTCLPMIGHVWYHSDIVGSSDREW